MEHGFSLPSRTHRQTTLPWLSNDKEIADEGGMENASDHETARARDAKPGTRYLDLPDVGRVILEKSRRARRLILSVKVERVRVAVPRRVSFEKAEAFARANRDWIAVQQTKVRAAEERERRLQTDLPPIDREVARTHLVSRLEELADLHDLAHGRVSIRSQRTRWGSCSSRNNISLNMKLLWLPVRLQDYVLLHELVHTQVPDHSPRFWHRLEQVCPGARRLRRELREYRYCLTADVDGA